MCNNCKEKDNIIKLLQQQIIKLNHEINNYKKYTNKRYYDEKDYHPYADDDYDR